MAIHPIVLTGAVATGLALALSGCGTTTTTTTTTTTSSATDWAGGIRALGMLPVDPPSEDVRVGDVYVYAADKDPHTGQRPARPTTSFLAASGRWYTLDVLADLSEEYRQRPAFPMTPDAFLQVNPEPSSRQWSESTARDGRSLFEPQEGRDRLSLVDLNALSGTAFSDTELNSFIPTEAVNLTLGTAWLDEKAVTLRVSSAESYALSKLRLIERLMDEGAPTDGTSPVLRDDIRRSIALLAPESETVWIEVVSEVLYVRSLDITIQAAIRSREDDVLATTELMPADVGGASDATAADGEENDAGSATKAVAAAGHDLDPIYGAFQRASAVNDVLVGADADDVPGGFVRFISITDESVAMRRIWQRGLAVGVRGVTLEVDRRTGTIRQVHSLLRKVPGT